MTQAKSPVKKVSTKKITSASSPARRKAPAIKATESAPLKTGSAKTAKVSKTTKATKASEAVAAPTEAAPRKTSRKAAPEKVEARGAARKPAKAATATKSAAATKVASLSKSVAAKSAPLKKATSLKATPAQPSKSSAKAAASKSPAINKGSVSSEPKAKIGVRKEIPQSTLALFTKAPAKRAKASSAEAAAKPSRRKPILTSHEDELESTEETQLTTKPAGRAAKPPQKRGPARKAAASLELETDDEDEFEDDDIAQPTKVAPKSSHHAAKLSAAASALNEEDEDDLEENEDEESEDLEESEDEDEFEGEDEDDLEESEDEDLDEGDTEANLDSADALDESQRPLPSGVIRRRNQASTEAYVEPLEPATTEQRARVTRRQHGQGVTGLQKSRTENMPETTSGPPMILLGRLESCFDLPAPSTLSKTRRSSRWDSSKWRAMENAARRLGRNLNGEQRSLVKAIIEGHNAITQLAPGVDHIYSYLVASMLLDQPTLIISPSRYWLKQQQEQLNARGIPNVRIDSATHSDERQRSIERIRDAKSLAVLTTPSTLQRADICRALRQSGIALAAVIDAQRFSEFSPSFNPSSACLDELLELLGSPVTAVSCSAVSATVASDVIDGLNLGDPQVFEGNWVRRNVRPQLKVFEGDTESAAQERQQALLNTLNELPLPGIVVCPSPEQVEAIYQAAESLGLPCHRYHTGLSQDERSSEQHLFSTGKPAIMVAQSGYTYLADPLVESGELLGGYGRNGGRRDIRYLIHYGAPASLEQYLYDLNLVGRDGMPSDALMFYHAEDTQIYTTEQLRRQPVESLQKLLTALVSHASHQDTAGVAPLALEKLSERLEIDVESLRKQLDVFGAAGLVLVAGDWMRITRKAPELDAEGQFLLEQLESVAEHDALRLEMVEQFAEPPSEEHPRCLVARINYLFGVERLTPCGHCFECGPNHVPPPRGPRHPPRPRHSRSSGPSHSNQRGNSGQRHSGSSRGGGERGSSQERRSSPARRFNVEVQWGSSRGSSAHSGEASRPSSAPKAPIKWVS